MACARCPLHPPSYAGHMRVDFLDAHSKKAVSLCLLLAALRCAKGPLKPLAGRTPFLSVCILDQPRPSETSPPPPTPRAAAVGSAQRSPQLCLAQTGLAETRPLRPFARYCPLRIAVWASAFPVCTSASLAAILCSLLPARLPVRAQPLSPAKPSARRYPRSQKALITSGPRAAIQHGQLPPASRERHSQPHSATLISRRRRAGASTY
jgi:hypothetical protein